MSDAIIVLNLFLILLKLTDTVDWSWWIIMSPLLFTLVIDIVVVVYVIIDKIYDYYKYKYKD